MGWVWVGGGGWRGGGGGSQSMKGLLWVPWPAIWTQIQGLRLSPGHPPARLTQPGTKLTPPPQPSPTRLLSLSNTFHLICPSAPQMSANLGTTSVGPAAGEGQVPLTVRDGAEVLTPSCSPSNTRRCRWLPGWRMPTNFLFEVKTIPFDEMFNL